MPALVTIRLVQLADIPALMEIRASVSENRLSDPSRVPYEDYITLHPELDLLNQSVAGAPDAV